MDRQDTVAKLSTLIRVDETAGEAYLRVAAKLSDAQAAADFARIAVAHHRQAESIRQVLHGMGEPQHPRSEEFEYYVGTVIAGVERARHGDELLGRARQAEVDCLLQYADAADAELPLQAGRLVRRHLARDETYLDFIDALRSGARR
jgi:hypothetical protein